jgi:hypothetical protein
VITFSLWVTQVLPALAFGTLGMMISVGVIDPSKIPVDPYK